MMKAFCALGSNGAPSNLLNYLLWSVARGKRIAKPLGKSSSSVYFPDV